MSSSNSLIDEFENSFQSCLSALTNSSTSAAHIHDSDEVKTSVEQTIQRFLDIARQIECFFLQKRLLLSAQKPELIIAEDINELRSEILRKDQILAKYYEKLQIWQSMISETVAPMPPNAGTLQRQTSLTGSLPVSVSGVSAPQSQLPSLPSLPVQSNAQTQLRHPNVGSSTLSTHAMMQTQPQTQALPNANPNPQMLPPQTPPMVNTTQNSAALMNQMAQTGAQPMPQFMQQQSQSHTGGLQGPLAYLERTTSNIGLPDLRR